MTSDSTPAFEIEKEALKTEIETGIQAGVDHLEANTAKRKDADKYHNTRHLSGSVSLIVLILVLIVAWNYIKLLFEAAERYILVGVLIYTAPVAFATGASENTSNVFSAWCRMLGGQLFLLIMNAWCLRLFTSMVGSFLANPLSV